MHTLQQYGSVYLVNKDHLQYRRYRYIKHIKGAFNTNKPSYACAARVTVVDNSVCLSVCTGLISEMTSRTVSKFCVRAINHE